MKMGSTIIDHKGVLKYKQTLYASEFSKKHLNLNKIQKMVVYMRGMMVQEKQYSRARKRNIKSNIETIVTLSDRFTKKR